MIEDLAERNHRDLKEVGEEEMDRMIISHLEWCDDGRDGLVDGLAGRSGDRPERGDHIVQPQQRDQDQSGPHCFPGTRGTSGSVGYWGNLWLLNMDWGDKCTYTYPLFRFFLLKFVSRKFYSELIRRKLRKFIRRNSHPIKN